MTQEETEGLYDESGSTPSQALLDQQQQSQQVAAAYREQGKLQMAAAQIHEAISAGGDAATGRELLGRLDSLAQGEGEDEALYQDFSRFLRVSVRGPEPAKRATAPASQGTAPAAKRDLNKARADYASGRTNKYPG